ncbi:unnamed protein product [Rotaria sordida]|uniref:Uncharacterized protein n=1 Tax=Rotaria sordida TaxID=392033 RepID=A0A814C6Z8_9BILA|nr:unnamed protein product [Rotaria sordida]
MYVLPTRELNDGNRIPINGLRLFQADVYIGTINLVKLATREGYHLFDTAQLYENEFKTGQCLRLSGVSRQQLFITKLYTTAGGRS